MCGILPTFTIQYKSTKYVTIMDPMRTKKTSRPPRGTEVNCYDLDALQLYCSIPVGDEMVP